MNELLYRYCNLSMNTSYLKDIYCTEIECDNIVRHIFFVFSLYIFNHCYEGFTQSLDEIRRNA